MVTWEQMRLLGLLTVLALLLAVRIRVGQGWTVGDVADDPALLLPW